MVCPPALHLLHCPCVPLCPAFAGRGWCSLVPAQPQSAAAITVVHGWFCRYNTGLRHDACCRCQPPSFSRTAHAVAHRRSKQAPVLAAYANAVGSTAHADCSVIALNACLWLQKGCRCCRWGCSAASFCCSLVCTDMLVQGLHTFRGLAGTGSFSTMLTTAMIFVRYATLPSLSCKHAGE